MKRIVASFAVTYAFFFSLGSICLLNLAGIMLASAIDGGVINEYPRFIPFCYLIGFVALIALVVCFILNKKHALNLRFTGKVWAIELISAFAASIPMMALWDLLFDFLQKTF